MKRWIISFGFFLFGATASAQNFSGVPCITNGNTLLFDSEVIRLLNIDAPRRAKNASVETRATVLAWKA